MTQNSLEKVEELFHNLVFREKAEELFYSINCFLGTSTMKTR